MDTLHIGIKAQRAEELFTDIARQARDAMNRAGDDEIPAQFEVSFIATDNDSGEQVHVTVNNDDMERDEVALQDVYLEVDA